MATARARRYARAIFDLAREDNDLKRWGERIESVRALLDEPDLREVLANPTVPPSQRVQLVETVTQQRLDEGALNLARLLVSAGAIGAIDDIAAAYQELVDEAEGRVRATAVTAVELPQQEWRRVERELSERMGREVRLDARVDPRVIGGVLLEVGDRVIDGTVAGRLSQLRRALVTSS
jgi:F-type H+-transporting ATPase subunit delta